MGSDRNYLTVEVTAAANVDAVTDALQQDETFDERHSRSNGNVVAVGRSRETDPAVESLHAISEHVSRALLVHVYDTVMSGTGWFYEQQDGELREVETFEGGEPHYGIDVVDYFKREYNFDGAR